MLSNMVSASHFFPIFIALEKLDYINSLEMCAVKIITYCRGSTFPPVEYVPPVYDGQRSSNYNVCAVWDQLRTTQLSCSFNFQVHDEKISIFSAPLLY